MKTSVFIACSLDGYIADKMNSLDWLLSIPNETGSDFGYGEFITSIDCVVMGRRTFDFVRRLEKWPYDIPAFVTSTSMKAVPSGLEGKCRLISGEPKSMMESLGVLGFKSVYGL